MNLCKAAAVGIDDSSDFFCEPLLLLTPIFTNARSSSPSCSYFADRCHASNYSSGRLASTIGHKNNDACSIVTFNAPNTRMSYIVAIFNIGFEIHSSIS